MDQSAGTRTFIADCNRLLDRCGAQVPKGNVADIGEAMEVILGLLRHIDERHGDVIFFADEAASWQVGVDWVKVLPALFSRLSRTMEAEEYARRVVEVVAEFDGHSDRSRVFAQRARVVDARPALPRPA